MIMAEYEFFNQKVDERNAIINNQKQKPIGMLIRILAPVAIALAVFALLEAIGFISTGFSLTLSIGTMCYGSFKIGRIWHKIKF
jgi:hypothetical protein